jgi:hypothetical protein
MWLDENTGTRINEARTAELLTSQPDVIAAACPYCVDMLADGMAARADGTPAEVVDVAQVLLRSVRPAAAPQPRPVAVPAGRGAAPATHDPEGTRP